ncbi:MAG: TetR/AcrR family transcriptional regulator [Gammaproteobacteria bacterium]|nr:TetR/AcrR family transcriptional regulator [Gammaproteobacteria bacterium]
MIKSTRTPAKHPNTVKRNRARRMSPEERKSQLLQTALQAFARKGLANGCHNDIAELAGVSVPTVFHYFPSSDDLVDAVLKEVTRFLIEEFVQVRIVDERQSGAEAIRTMLGNFASAIDKRPDPILIWLHWSTSVQEQYWGDYLEFYREALRVIKVLVLRGVRDGTLHPHLDPDAACRVIYSCANTIATMIFARENPRDVDATIDSVVNGYLRAQR